MMSLYGLWHQSDEIAFQNPSFSTTAVMIKPGQSMERKWFLRPNRADAQFWLTLKRI
jgi:hypothetical protein